MKLTKYFCHALTIKDMCQIMEFIHQLIFIDSVISCKKIKKDCDKKEKIEKDCDKKKETEKNCDKKDCDKKDCKKASCQ